MRRWIAATLTAMILGGAVLDAHKGDHKHKGKKDRDEHHASHVDARDTRNVSVSEVWSTHMR